MGKRKDILWEREQRKKNTESLFKAIMDENF